MQTTRTRPGRMRLLIDTLVISGGMLISLAGYFGNTIQWHLPGL